MAPNRTLRLGSRVVVRLSSSDHPNSDLRALIHGHPFNHAVQALLPLPDSAETALDSAGSEALAAFNAVVTAVSASQCYAARVELAALVGEDFIKTHLVGGAHSIAALSVNTPLDRTDAAALTPDGRLHLALTGDTHERLGLLGARSATSPGGYRVTLNLASRKFSSAHPHYHKVRDALSQRAAPLDMLFVAVNQQGPRPDPAPDTQSPEPAESPEALDLSGLPGVHSWQPQRLRYAHCRRSPAALPDLAACLIRAGAAEPRPSARANPGGGSACVADQPRQAARGSGSSGPMDVDAAPAAPAHGALANGGLGLGSGLASPAERVLQAEAQASAQGRQAAGEPPRAGEAGVPAGVLAAVHEWLGAQACGFAELDAGALSAAADLPVDARPRFLAKHRWQGLLAGGSVERLIAACRRLLRARACPWAALSVWGFEDAPVSWAGAEHGRSVLGGGAGENYYHVVLLPGEQYAVFVAAGAADCFTKF